MPNTKKYISLSKLGTFLENLKATFSALNHKHTLSDIEDYVVDSELSHSSINPVQNNVINSEFEAMSTAMLALDAAIDTKSDAGHVHDDAYYPIAVMDSKLSEKADIQHFHPIGEVEGLQDLLNEKVPETRVINGKTLEEDITLSPEDILAAPAVHDHNDIYYQKTEVDAKFEVVNTSISNIEDGTTVVAKAAHAVDADNAEHAVNADNATHDSIGNVIKDTYETKSDAALKLSDAKSYADGIKNDLLNGAGDAYDTLKELGDLIDDNKDTIDALRELASGKADRVHTHAISDVTNLQNTLNAIDVNISGIESNIREINTDISDIETDINGININISDIETSIGNIQNNISKNQADIVDLQEEDEKLQANIAQKTQVQFITWEAND